MRLLWSRPQTPSHVVLVQPGGDWKIGRVRETKWSRSHMVLVRPGGNRRVKKIIARAEMGHEQSKRDRARERRWKQRDIASEVSKTKEKSLTDTLTTLRSLSETLQTTALPSSPLYSYISSPALSTYTLHMVTTDIYLHISGYSSARGILCACVFLVIIMTLLSIAAVWVENFVTPTKITKIRNNPLYSTYIACVYAWNLPSWNKWAASRGISLWQVMFMEVSLCCVK